MSFIKSILKHVKPESKQDKVKEAIAQVAKIDPSKVVGLMICVAMKTDEKDSKGTEIVELDTKMVGESFTLLSINQGLNDALIHILAEEAQGKVITNLGDKVTKH
jgi:hypothetical protein